MLTLKIIGGILALFLGVLLGMPGRYRRKTDEELERLLDHGGGSRYKVRRSFTPLDWFRTDERASSRRSERSRFRTAAPKRRQDQSMD